MQLCKPSLGSIALLGLFLASCAGLSPVYPARPPETPGEPIADPSPSRVVLHATITGPALRTALEERFPATGEGTVPLVGKDRKFTWKREPVAIRFDKGRIGVDLHMVVTLEMPVSRLEF